MIKKAPRTSSHSAGSPRKLPQERLGMLVQIEQARVLQVLVQYPDQIEKQR